MFYFLVYHNLDKSQGFSGTSFDRSCNMDDPFNESNYNFKRDESKALCTLNPGEQKWVTMRIWLEGQDENCVKEIAGEKFDLVLKFDSAFVE